MAIVGGLNGYIPSFEPMSNVTPFTYRDGATYLEVLEGIRTYVNDTLVVFVNQNFGVLSDLFEEQVNLLITNVEAQLDAQSATVTGQLAAETTFVNQSIADLTTYVNNAVQTILNSSIEVAGTVVLALINNGSSDVRSALDGLYAAKSMQTLIESGRLSQTSLDAAYAAKTVQTLIESGRLTQANLDAAYLAAALGTGSGRLSQASLDAAYLAASLGTGAGRLSAASLEAAFDPRNLTGTYAARPAATSVKAGTLYFATDVPEVYRSNATIWSVVSSGGNELGRAITTANFGPVSTLYNDIPGLTLSFMVGERPIEVTFDGTIEPGSATNLAQVRIFMDGTTELRNASKTGGGFGTSGYINFAGVVSAGVLTPGTIHTFKAQLSAVGSSPAVYSNNSAASPSVLRARTI